jgi:O-antigen/teichoic acid export membrane protein
MLWGKVIAFGWPLIANGLLMFLILNGDRMVVLNRFGPAALGWFSAAVMLTLMPANLIAKSLQTITLPALAQAQDDPAAFRRIYEASVAAAALVVMAMVMATLLLGEFAVTLLFGAKFLPASTYLTALACMNGLRLFRAIPAIAAMARGETRDPLYANLVRVVGVPAALVAALVSDAIAPMIVAGILAELVSATLAGRLARRHIGPHRATDDRMLVLLALSLASATAVSWHGGHWWLLLLPVALLVALCAATPGLLPRWSLARPRHAPVRRSRRA